jgi:capsular exopolysaccharide synthesis family protein
LTRILAFPSRRRENLMQLRDFLVVLRARWRIVLAGVVVVLAATTAVTLSETPVYTSEARFFLQGVDQSKGDGNLGTYIVTTEDLNTYVAVLGSPAVLAPLRERLGLPPGTPVDVSASVSEEASILTVAARSSDPQLAADIANAMGPQLAEVADQFSVLLAASQAEIEATTITPAGPSATPTSPDLKRNLALGGLAGLMLGVGLAFVRHTLDTKVRAEADLKLLSPSPLLALLPMDRDKEPGIALERNPYGAYAEAIRRLRTNLMFVVVTTGRHSFAVTSAVPGEGKTTTAVNLAVAMATAGGRILLVDGDLRNPSVARRMDLDGSVGLTTVLLGKADLEDVVQRWGDTDLYVLAAGQIPPNPSELLGSEPMQDLFSKMTQEYDFVLVDSPPVVPVIDAVLIDKLTGGTLIVVASNRTKKRDLVSALKSLETVGGTVSGFALNMVAPNDVESTRYGYYRYQAPPAAEKKSTTSPPAKAQPAAKRLAKRRAT